MLVRITNRCQMGCSHCFTDSTPEGQHMTHHTFEQALQATVSWYVDNEWWWRKIKSGEYREYYQAQYGHRLSD